MLTIRLNGKPHAITSGSIADLLVEQGLQRRRGVAVAVNGDVVPAAAWRDCQLAPGDDVEIVRPVGGG